MIQDNFKNICEVLENNEISMSKEQILRIKMSRIILTALKIICITSIPLAILIYNNQWEVKIGYIITFLTLLPISLILWIIDVYNRGWFDKDDFFDILKEVQTLRVKLLKQIHTLEKNIENLNIEKNLDCISNVSKEINKLMELFIEYREKYLMFNRKYSKFFFLRDLFSKKNIHAYVLNQSTFINQLYHWIKPHINQLLEVQKELLINQKDIISNIENSNWKTILESQKVRLQSYIESINNLVK